LDVEVETNSVSCWRWFGEFLSLSPFFTYFISSSLLSIFGACLTLKLLELG